MKSEQYIFALLATEEVPPLDELRSFDDTAVTALSFGDLSAIVSDFPEGKLRPRRANLRVHHLVIDSLIQSGASPLPFSFGTGATEEEIATLISTNREEFRSRIEKIRGCVEVSLKLKSKPGELFSLILDAAPELARERDLLFLDGREPTREEKIMLGQRFDLARTQIQDQLLGALKDTVQSVSRDTLTNDGGGEELLGEMICLVQREESATFEAAINAVAGQFDDRLVLQLSPYLAPYSFADINL